MTIAIEQLIKMHDPRCMSIESLNVGRGQGILSKDQIVGSFASAQHQHAVGFDLLMAKYRHDVQAEQRIRDAIAIWARNKSSRPLSVQACQLALLMVLERNLPAQIEDVAKLLRRYSAKAGQTRKNTDGLRAEIKQLERLRCRDRVTDDEYQRVGEQIEGLAARIEAERSALRTWSQQHAMHSNVCPRCNGTGKTLRPSIAICNECGDRGRITATFEHLRKSLAITGAVMPAGEWPQYLGLVKQCMQWLYIEESATSQMLGKQIHNEIEA
ncbi:hypothetical protein J5069_02840 [Candidatus Symbiopectobacterium sp. NZEC127]|uniref:TIGR02642 family protein n=1 Tax=Candidatus Symbiopectobacterium sp. NZEC127 TaxID=2820472 RepID=UPI002226B183|nr:TIGR02642 family protein [Candidatus Symbiopectobacterium sp. NZEC127]MCW2484827.1 hypothetical protein [Candidatus Symbiopectobacterium sp. NZEC127]